MSVAGGGSRRSHSSPLLWCESIAADCVAAVSLPPRPSTQARALALFAGSDQIKEEIGRLCEVRGLGWLKGFNTHKNSLEWIQLLEDWEAKLVAVASAAVGDVAPLEDNIEGVAAEERADAVHKVVKQCISITS
nr:hypothetical protein HK105_002898 [Polyrhizophydium stewartii]